MPKKSEKEKELREQRKKLRKKIDNATNEEESISQNLEFKERVAQHLTQSNLEANNKQRQFSNCVVSRWYRAPEIILTQKRYD